MSRLNFISKEKLLEMIENKDDFYLVDALSSESFEKGHIIGSVSLPAHEVEERASEVLSDKNKMVVTYCASFTCSASSNAANKLMELGYSNVADYKGGLEDWKTAGLGLVTK